MSAQQTNLKAIADAIREKDGTSEPIPAKTFPERIRAIKTGSGFAVPLQVDVDPGAEIIATLGDDSVSGIADASGKVNLILPKGGVWTVGATLGDKSVTPKELEVVKGYSLKFSFASRLPEGYTELAYVDTSAGTGYQAVLYRYFTLTYSKHNRVVSDMQAVALNSSNRVYFWRADKTAQTSAYDNHLDLVYESNTLIAKDYYSSSGYTATLFTGDIVNRRLVVDWNIFTGDVSLDGEYVATVKHGSTVSSTRTEAISIPLQNNPSGGAIRIFGFKVYTDDVVVSDLVPVQNASGIVGFYDVIQNKFFTHYGTNYKFIAGPEV